MRLNIRNEWKQTGLKVCSRCKTVKTVSEFYIGKTGKTAGQICCRCRTCCVKVSKQYSSSKPEEYERIVRPYYLKKKYGISVEQYDNMLLEQNNKCAICKSDDPKSRRYIKGKSIRFSVDHCHTTGKVRGLLCAKCNNVLGLINDNPEIALRLATYLQKYRSQ
jgi:hypothetical protein